MPPVVIGGAIAAAGAVGAAAIGNRGASRAADVQAQSNAQNVGLQRDIYDRNVRALAPWQQLGTTASDNVAGLLGLTGAARREEAEKDFRRYIRASDYGFQFGQGANAINSGYAASGTLQSGAAMKGLERFRQNLQSGYRNEYLNNLMSQQNLGFGAASAQAGVGQSFANNVSALNAQNANALAGLEVQRANNTAGAIGALGQIGGYLSGNLLGGSNSLAAGTPQSGRMYNWSF